MRHLSRTSMSSGSVKMSIVSNPRSLVFWMPHAVSRPACAHAELISPSFIRGLSEKSHLRQINIAVRRGSDNDSKVFRPRSSRTQLQMDTERYATDLAVDESGCKSKRETNGLPAASLKRPYPRRSLSKTENWATTKSTKDKKKSCKKGAYQAGTVSHGL